MSAVRDCLFNIFAATLHIWRSLEWRRKHNKKLYALYYSPNIIRMIKSRRLRWAEPAARMRKGKTPTGLAVNPEGRRPLGRPRQGWEDNIKMELTEVG